MKLNKFVSVSLLSLLLLGLILNFLPVVKADINFISVDNSVIHDSIRTTEQHHTFWDLNRYWIFYFNTTYINYRTVFRNGTVSQEYALRAWTHGKSFSIWNNSTSHEISYVWSDAALYQSGVYYRKGILQNNNTISWVAAEQTVIPPSATFAYYQVNIAVDSEGYPWVCYFRGIYGGSDWFTVVKSSSKDGTWTNATGFPNELWESVSHGSLLPLTDGKMYVVATWHGHNPLGWLWNGASFGNNETIMSQTTDGDHSVTAVGNTIYFAALNDSSYVVLAHRPADGSWVEDGALWTDANEEDDWDDCVVMCADSESDYVYAFSASGHWHSDDNAEILARRYKKGVLEPYTVVFNQTSEYYFTYFGCPWKAENGNLWLVTLRDQAGTSSKVMQLLPIEGFASDSIAAENTANENNGKPYIKYSSVITNFDYLESGFLNFTVDAYWAENSTTEVYCGSKSEPLSVSGADSWTYDSDTKICTINVVLSSAHEITLDWRYKVYVHVTDSNSSADIEGATVYLSTPLWTSDSDITNSTGWALCIATAPGTYTIHASKLNYSSNSTSIIIENATQTESIQLTAGLYTPWFDERVYIGTAVAVASGVILAYVYRRKKKQRVVRTP